MFIFDNGGGGLCSASDVTAGTAAGSTTTPWCTDTTKALGNSQKSTSVRTLKGFATKDYSTDKLTGKDGGNYGEQLPPIYTAYWADATKGGYTAAEAAIWADTFVRKDYTSIVQPAGSNQLMKKGANYQAVWMYVLHELEDAIGDCYAGDITANDGNPTGGAPHAWDEGWAFYAGSTVGQTVAQSVTDVGTLIFELAEKRSGDFKTDHSTGPATTNVHLLAKFIEGRDLIGRLRQGVGRGLGLRCGHSPADRPVLRDGGGHDQNEHRDLGVEADGGRLRSGQDGDGVDVPVPWHHVRRRRRVHGHHGVHGPGRVVRRRHGPLRSRSARPPRPRVRRSSSELEDARPTKFPSPFPTPR